MVCQYGTKNNGRNIYIYENEDCKIKGRKRRNVKEIGQLVGFEVLTAVVMKSSIFWDKHRIMRRKSRYVSEEHAAFIFRVVE
jgi:hypothetical protein